MITFEASLREAIRVLKAYSESGGKNAGDMGEFNDQLEHRWVWSSYVFLSHVYGQQSECLQSFREHVCNNVKFHGYRLFSGWGRGVLSTGEWRTIHCG